MASGKKKFETITTPKGRAQFPYLNTPDTKFNSAGEYKVNLVLPKSEAAQLMEKIDELTEAHWNEVYNKAKAKDKKRLQKHYPYEDVFDEETEEPTGDVVFKFKMNAQIKKDDGTVIELSPKLFDKKGRALDKDEFIRGGSIIRVNAQLVPYKVAATGHVGISLRLVAVQVIEFGQGGSAEDFGFEVEEDDDDGESQQEGFQDESDETPDDDDQDGDF